MNIVEAANKLKEGKKIKRKSWNDWEGYKDLYLENDLFLCHEGKILYLHLPNEDNFRFEFHIEDILANDWEVVE